MSQDEASTLTASISAQPAETVIQTSVIRASSSSSEVDSEAPVTVLVTQTRSASTTSKTSSSSSNHSTVISPSTTPTTTHSVFSIHPTTLQSTLGIYSTSTEAPATIQPLASTAASNISPPSADYGSLRFNPLSPEAAGLIAAICALIIAIITTTAVYLHFRSKLKATLKHEQRMSKHEQTWQQRAESLAPNGTQPTRPARPYTGAI